MDNKTDKSKKIMLGKEQLHYAAKEAFYGNNEPLSDYIKDVLSYIEGGRRYPANGYSLADAIRVVSTMDCRTLIENFGQTGTQILCFNCDRSYNRNFLLPVDIESGIDGCCLCGSRDVHELYVLATNQTSQYINMTEFIPLSQPLQGRFNHE